MSAPSERAHTHRLRVRYAETDQMGVAYHANYLAWFEEGRTEWLRAAGQTYRDLEERGVLLAVTEVKLNYYRSARYDDLLVVTTKLVDRRRASLRFHYAIRRDGETELLAEGETELACIERGGRLQRLPADLPF